MYDTISRSVLRVPGLAGPSKTFDGADSDASLIVDRHIVLVSEIHINVQ